MAVQEAVQAMLAEVLTNRQSQEQLRQVARMLCPVMKLPTSTAWPSGCAKQ
jgi:hypothetical protein